MKFHWVNDDVKIDFYVPKGIRQVMEEAERLDLEESYAYVNWANQVDTDAKNAYAVGALTREQWDTLCRRYPVNIF